MALRVGLIGGGSAGRVHLEEYLSDDRVEPVAVAEPNSEVVEDLQETFDIPKVVHDYGELIHDASIDLVDICLPHHLHHDVTLEALQAGKDVILEKPIALSLDQADRMLAQARRSGRRFFVALNQRFVPAHARAKELIDEGRLGRIFLALGVCIGDEFGRMDDPDSWKGTWDRAGGGVLADTGTHFVDVLQYFFGLPRAVSATTRRLAVSAEGKGDDTSVVTLEFEEGIVAELVLTYCAIADSWSERKEIYGTGGSLRICSEDPEEPLVLIEGRRPRALPDVKHPGNWWSSSVRRCVRHFIDCLTEDVDPVVTPLDARAALATILAAYRSSREGRRIALGWELPL